MLTLTQNSCLGESGELSEKTLTRITYKNKMAVDEKHREEICRYMVERYAQVRMDCSVRERVHSDYYII